MKNIDLQSSNNDDLQMEIMIQPNDVLTDNMGEIIGGGPGGPGGCKCNSGFLCDRYTSPGGPAGTC